MVAADTSVAIPLLVRTHPDHRAVAEWAQHRSLVLSGHAHAETYSVLTRLPAGICLAPADALELLNDNFVAFLPAPPTSEMLAELVRCNVAGGATYDGLVALAARHHDVVLATRDARAHTTYSALGVFVELIH